MLDSGAVDGHDRGDRVAEEHHGHEPARVPGHVVEEQREEQCASHEGCDGARTVADDRADPEPEQGEERQEGARFEEGTQDAGVAERGGGRATGEDGLADEEGQEAQDEAEDRGRRCRRRSPWRRRTRCGGGLAARDERMVPLPYSPVMDSTPRTPMTSDAEGEPGQRRCSSGRRPLA